MSEVDTNLLEQAAAELGTRDGLFMKRCWTGGLDKYRRRLAAIGFTGLDCVLDAGCGFGQWSMVMAENCGKVEAFDVCEKRVRAAQIVAKNAINLRFRTASLEELPFANESFDGVFCYSTIYYTDVRRSVAELCRVLRPGGRIYLCSNGPGWYWYNFVHQPHKSADFSPRRYALGTFYGTAKYFLFNQPPRNGQSVITPRRWLARMLESHGVEIRACGDEGACNLSGDKSPQNFFRGRYAGLECVSEWLGVRRKAVGQKSFARAA